MTHPTAAVLDNAAAWGVDCGDARQWLPGLPADSVHCCVTSPPYYGLRDYGNTGQIGLEESPDRYVAEMVGVFREVRRVLHPSGTLWLNLGDSFAAGGGQGRQNLDKLGERLGCGGGHKVSNGDGRRCVTPAGAKPKDLLMIPARVAMALQADGWYLRQRCPWVKRNPMPESVGDRPSTACEEVFLLSKESEYFFDMEAVKRRGSENSHGGTPIQGGPKQKAMGQNQNGLMGTPAGDDGRNFRSADLWFDSVGMLLAGGDDTDATLLGFDVTLKPYKGAHFAVMPKGLIRPCVRAGTSAKGVCPKCGNPWTRQVERERTPTRPGIAVKQTSKRTLGDVTTVETLGWNKPNAIGNRDPQRHCTTTKTTGWEPGCGCPDNVPVPAVMLDPFAGSGTVLAVAVDEGRRAIGCELNGEYLPLIRKRMAGVTPPMFPG